MKIAPSLLAADGMRYGEELQRAAALGADCIHIDVMDGMFVPNITFGPYMIRDMRKATKLTLDVHLMVQAPERYVEAFAEAGADIIVVHEEATTHLDRTLQMIRAAGKKCGVALNPHTPLSVLEYVLDGLDQVLLMSVNPGFGGQSFLPYSLDKARALKAMIDARGLDIDIEMDGGIGLNNVAKVTAAGVNVLVAGNAVFAAPDPAEVIRRLKRGK